MSTQTANSIASRLNSGALPVKIGSPISQETVGPTLGSVSLQKSLWAGIFGLLAVVIFIASLTSSGINVCTDPFPKDLFPKINALLLSCNAPATISDADADP